MNIERMQPADFDAVYRLLTQSFPATERRGAAGQRALFSDSAYRVDILRAPDGGVQALIASWDFDDFCLSRALCRRPRLPQRRASAGRCSMRCWRAAASAPVWRPSCRRRSWPRGASAFTSGTASRSMRIMPTSSRHSRRRRPAADAPAHDRRRMHKCRAARDGDACAHARVRQAPAAER